MEKQTVPADDGRITRRLKIRGESADLPYFTAAAQREGMILADIAYCLIGHRRRRAECPVVVHRTPSMAAVCLIDQRGTLAKAYIERFATNYYLGALAPLQRRWFCFNLGFSSTTPLRTFRPDQIEWFIYEESSFGGRLSKANLRWTPKDRRYMVDGWHGYYAFVPPILDACVDAKTAFGQSTSFSDALDVMEYPRHADIMPHVIAYRPRSDLCPDPDDNTRFVMLDTDDEVAEFKWRLRQPLTFSDDNQHVVFDELQYPNCKPARLVADVHFTEFYYPRDEGKGWPLLMVHALSCDALATMTDRPVEIVRNRYVFQRFAPDEKPDIIRQIHQSKCRFIVLSGEFPPEISGVFNRRPTSPPN